jgi:hypothetical protein
MHQLAGQRMTQRVDIGRDRVRTPEAVTDVIVGQMPERKREINATIT